MRASIRPLCIVLAAALAASLGACSSTDSSGGTIDMEGPGGDIPTDAKPVTGNVRVILRTWDPNRPELGPSTHALVNETSESGKRLSSGRATSTVTRVVTDHQMGVLLAMLDQEGFAAHSKSGVTIEGLTDDSRRRGVIVVENNGSTRGLESLVQANLGGTAIPTVFRDCKIQIIRVHSAIPGYEARASSTPADERTFQAPPIKVKR